MIGKTVLEILPSKNNPRNSEGAFLKLKDGSLMYCYTKYVGDSVKDEAPTCIAMRISKDGGYTFSQDKILFMCQDFDLPHKKCQNIMSVSLLRMMDGAIGLFFLIRYGFDDMCEYIFRSYDEGQTYEKPIKCCSPGYFVTNNDRVVRLSNNRIIVPGNFHRMVDEGNYNTVAQSCFFVSDDDGFTWRESDEYCSLQDKKGGAGLQETGVVELKNGVLWALSRTTKGCHYQSFSFDYGDSWTTPEPSVFVGPCSPLSIKRANSGELVTLWNPIPFYPTQKRTKSGWGRTPLVLSVSYDDGKTWGDPYIIDDAQDEGYCYTAIHFEENHMVIAYCAGGEKDGVCLCKIRIKVIKNNEIEIGEFSHERQF